MKKICREKLFSETRHAIFGGRFQQKQVDGIEAILKAWEESEFDDLRWLGYMFGTAYHETAATMRPIKEYGNNAYFKLMYDVEGRRPGVARSMGNTNPGDGALYCGRGYVQLTWKNNYARAGKLLGIDLVGNPNLAMKPDVAARIMFAGMTDAEIVFEDLHDDQNFTFTGRTLEDYFSPTVEDWYNARRIINGLDHATMIAATAKDFYEALDYT